MEPDEVLASLGGVARSYQLAERGIYLDDLVAAAETGTIVRLRKGVWALEAGSDRSRAAAHGGALTCASVLARHGVWLLHPPTRLHVEIGAHGRRHRHVSCHCITHHFAPITAFGVASVAHALITASRCLPLEELFVAYESASRLGLISTRERGKICEEVPRRIRRWLLRARGDADSGLESLFRFRLMVANIEVESQVQIDGVGRVDFRHGNVLFEIDGRRNHEAISERHKDLERDGAAAASGYRTLRFTYAMVVHQWPQTLERVRAALDLDELSALPTLSTLPALPALPTVASAASAARAANVAPAPSAAPAARAASAAPEPTSAG